MIFLLRENDGGGNEFFNYSISLLTKIVYYITNDIFIRERGEGDGNEFLITINSLLTKIVYYIKGVLRILFLRGDIFIKERG